MHRRQYLALIAAGALAGCLGGDGSDEDDSASGDDASGSNGDDSSDGDDSTSGDDESDSNGDDTDDSDGDDGSEGGTLFAQRWGTELDTNSVGGTTYSATAADGAVFVGSQAGLTALELSDGTQRWHREEVQSFTRVHADDQGVVALTREGVLVALDIASGSTRWTVDVEGTQEDVFHPTGLADTAALVSTGSGTTLYDRGSGDVIARVGDSERDIVAGSDVAVLVGPFEMVGVDPASGDQRWQTEVETTRGGALGDGTVVATSPGQLGDGASVVGVDAGSGDRLWEEPVEAVGAGFPEVDIGGGVATFRSNPVDGPDTLYVFDLENGSQRWTADLGDPVNPSRPRVTAGPVVAETDAEFVAFDRATGEELTATEAPFLTLDVVTGNGLFLTCAREVTAYEM